MSNPASTELIARIAANRAARDAERSIEQIRARAISQIEQMAEAVRLTFITPGDGQAMTYARKEARARELVSLADPALEDPAHWPLLAAEIGTTGATLVAVAHAVIAQADAWEPVAGQIEGARLRGKADVAAAATRSDIEAARAAAITALTLLGENA